MATISNDPAAVAGEHRFFLFATWLLAALTVAGFSLNVAMGRSSFDVPLVYHLHAFVFMSFVGLFVVQTTFVSRGNIAAHRKLGQIAFALIPLMLLLGIWLTFETLRILGGPPFFAQAEFLVGNIFHLGAFGILAFWALRVRSRPDWHKRLMFGAIATVCAPGIARLLPLPFMIPYVLPLLFAVVALFPIAGMVMDRRVHGRVHPAWWWALLVPIIALAIGELIAATEYAQSWVAGHVAGTPGAERPPEAFVPQGA